MDKPNTVTEYNDVLLEATSPAAQPKDNVIQVPPLSMRSLMLLSKINSPFVRDGELKIGPDGKPILDAKGRPQREPVYPQIHEIGQAFYVLVNQDRPDILDIINNAQTFERIVLDFAAKLTITKIQEVAGVIGKRMREVNDSVVGGPEISAKKETGPTPPSPEF